MLVSLIDDIHPSQCVDRAVSWEAYGADAKRIREHYKLLGCSPESIMDEAFWELPKSRLYDLGCSEITSGRSLFSPEEFEEMHALNIRELDATRDMLRAQYGLILSGRHEVLYHERRVYDATDVPWDPIAEAARKAGLRSIDLDEGNEATRKHDEQFREELHSGGILFPHQYDRSQEEREAEWVMKIRSDGWLNCGALHCWNQWGLLDRLRGMGVRTEVAFSCRGHSVELDAIASKRAALIADAYGRELMKLNG